MRYALLLVDVMKELFDKGGKFHYPAISKTVPKIKELLATFRQSKLPVYHIFERHRIGKPDKEFDKLPPHALYECVEDTVFLPEEIKSSDYLIFKRRFSAFFGTDLNLSLREEKVDTIVIAGCKTNVCIRATAQDAFQIGFEVIIAEDAVSSNIKRLHRASLEDISRYMGRILKVEEIKRTLYKGDDV